MVKTLEEMDFTVDKTVDDWPDEWLLKIHREAGLQASHEKVGLFDSRYWEKYNAFTHSPSYARRQALYDGHLTTARQCLNDRRTEEIAFEKFFSDKEYKFAPLLPAVKRRLFQRMFRLVITMHYTAVWAPAVRAREPDAAADIQRYRQLLKKFDELRDHFLEEPNDETRQLAVCVALDDRWGALRDIRRAYGLTERQVLRALSNADLVRNNIREGRYFDWFSSAVYNRSDGFGSRRTHYYDRIGDYLYYLANRRDEELARRRRPLDPAVQVRTERQVLELYKNWVHFVNELEMASNFIELATKVRPPPKIINTESDSDDDGDDDGPGGAHYDHTKRTGGQAIVAIPFDPETAGANRSPADREYVRQELADWLRGREHSLDDVLYALAQIDGYGQSGVVLSRHHYLRKLWAGKDCRGDLPNVKKQDNGFEADPIRRLYVIRELMALEAAFNGWQRSEASDTFPEKYIIRRKYELLSAIKLWRRKHRELCRTKAKTHVPFVDNQPELSLQQQERDLFGSISDSDTDSEFHKRVNRTATHASGRKRDSRAADLEPNQSHKRQSRGDSTHTEGRASTKIKKWIDLSKYIDLSADINDQLAALDRLIPQHRHCGLVPVWTKYMRRVRKHSDPEMTGLPYKWSDLKEERSDPGWRLVVIRDLLALDTALTRWRDDPTRSHEERESSGRHLEYLRAVLGEWYTRHTNAALESDENTSETSGESDDRSSNAELSDKSAKRDKRQYPSADWRWVAVNGRLVPVRGLVGGGPGKATTTTTTTTTTTSSSTSTTPGPLTYTSLLITDGGRDWTYKRPGGWTPGTVESGSILHWSQESLEDLSDGELFREVFRGVRGSVSHLAKTERKHKAPNSRIPPTLGRHRLHLRKTGKPCPAATPGPPLPADADRSAKALRLWAQRHPPNWRCPLCDEFHTRTVTRVRPTTLATARTAPNPTHIPPPTSVVNVRPKLVRPAQPNMVRPARPNMVRPARPNQVCPAPTSWWSRWFR